jgi:hypothetical protein
MESIRRWEEFEDWVEFYTARHLYRVGEGRSRAMINLGGPGAATNYHFYARVQPGREKLFTKVDVKDLEFHAAFEPVAVKGTPAEFRWVNLGNVKSRREYMEAVFTAPRKGSFSQTLQASQNHVLNCIPGQELNRHSICPSSRLGSALPINASDSIRNHVGNIAPLPSAPSSSGWPYWNGLLR